MKEAKWTPRKEEERLDNPSHHRPLIEKASRVLRNQGLSPADAQRIKLRTALRIDLEGDGKKDALVEAYVQDEKSGRVMQSALFVGGIRPETIDAPNLELFGDTRVLGATETTSEGAYLVLLESKTPTQTGYSVIQRTDQGFVSRGSWSCEHSK